MYLNYEFKNVNCVVEEDSYTHISRGYYLPHYKNVVRDIDYEYEVDISFADFFEYIRPYNFKDLSDADKETYINALYKVWNEDLIDLDKLEEDEDFIDFMKDKYEDDARKACEEENND